MFPFSWTSEKGHFQDGVQDGCRELKVSISKAIFNIRKSFLCQIIGLNSSFNIVKVPFLLAIRKNHFQDDVQDGCRELKFSISKAIFNTHKSFWCQTVGFNSSFIIPKVPFLVTITKESFSGWRQTVRFNSSCPVSVNHVTYIIYWKLRRPNSLHLHSWLIRILFSHAPPEKSCCADCYIL